MKEELKPGDKAPDFEGLSYGGEILSLKELLKKGPLVLYFYPRDNTPGCTKEACSMRDGIEEFKKLGIQVVGVSTDNVKSHENFRDKYNLNFPLISDKDGKIADKYGVRKPSGSAKRVTFLIDRDGTIRHIWKKVNTSKHAEEVISKIKEIAL